MRNMLTLARFCPFVVAGFVERIEAGTEPYTGPTDVFGSSGCRKQDESKKEGFRDQHGCLVFSSYNKVGSVSMC